MLKLFFAVSLMLIVLSFSGAAQTDEVIFSKSPKAAEKSEEFKSGDYIYAHLKFSKPLAGMLTINDKPVTLIVEYYVKDKMLDDEMFGFDPANIKNSKQNTIVLPIISEPAIDVTVFGKNLFAVRLPAALAKLPVGRHAIDYRLKSYNYKDGNELIAAGKFVLVIDAEAKAWYSQNEKDAMTAFSKRRITSVVVTERDLKMGVVGGKSVITLVNNCGRSVWLRKAIGSDKTEYRLAAGEIMRYDRDSGYLEEWNFGTKKWTTVNKVWAADSNGKANICSK